MYLFLLKLVFRFILKNIRIFATNVAGLGVVFAVTVFIVSWVKYEESYDRSFENADRLYRLNFEYTDGDVPRDYARINFEPWISNFYGYFPEVESIIRISGSIAGRSPMQSLCVRCGETRVDAKQGFEADSNFFKAFNIELLSGNNTGILKEPKSVILSKSFADKYYAHKNPIGQPFLIYRNDTVTMQYTITGIMPDFPAASHLYPQYLVSFDNPKNFNSIFYLYFLLKKNVSISDLENKFESFRKKYLTAEQQRNIIFHIQPVSDIHLHSNKLLDTDRKGSVELVYALKITSFLLLIIVFVNFINLQLAAFQSRKKYILINNIFGSRKKTVGGLLILEGLLTSITAVLLGVFLLALFSINIKTWLQITSPLFQSMQMLDYILFTVVFIISCLLCSLYPMFLLRRNLQKLGVKKTYPATFIAGKGETKMRTALVMAQFTIAIAMIIATLFISKQLKYSLDNRLGKDQDNIFTIINLPGKISENYRTFRQELLRKPCIKDITYHWYSGGKEPYACSNFTIDNKEPEDKKIYMFPVNYNFNTFYGIRLLAGEDFNEVEPGQTSVKYIINETAMHFLGYTKPTDVIGKPFQYDYFGLNYFEKGYISGVVEDTYIASFEVKEKPLAMYYMDGFLSTMSVKYEEGERSAALKAVNDLYMQMTPEKKPEIEHITELYQKVYKDYIKQQKLVSFILLVVVLISCMGLFAVASYVITNRTKEIGIRKVNGSKTFEIMAMLNKDFIKWIAISFIIACPISWYAMHKWLENFAYKTELSWWVFTAAGVIALVIALFTVSWQSWRAATRNPVESLRYE